VEVEECGLARRHAFRPAVEAGAPRRKNIKEASLVSKMTLRRARPVTSESMIFDTIEMSLC
jgi:hypothetical protein